MQMRTYIIVLVAFIVYVSIGLVYILPLGQFSGASIRQEPFVDRGSSIGVTAQNASLHLQKQWVPASTVSTISVVRNPPVDPGKASIAESRPKLASPKIENIFLPILSTKAPTSNTEESISEIISRFHPVRAEFKSAVDEYIQMHQRVMTGLTPMEDVKILQFTPTGQLCNRMRGTIAAFSLAFLTNRVFILKSFGYRETSSYFELFKSPGFAIEGPLPSSSDRNFEFINMGIDDGSDKVDMVQMFTCTDWSKFDGDLQLSGTDYTTTFLFRNPYLQRRVKELFLDEDIFRPILFWLFRPISEIETRRDDFLQKHNMLDSAGNRPYTIAFHIRNEFPISPNEWVAYKSCAEATVPHNRKTGPDPIWFIATDSEPAQDVARYNLNNNSLVYTQPGGFLKGARLEGLRQALTEILIASSCDSIFLTPFSSFSRMISLYARTPYTYLVTDFVMPEKDTHRTLTKIQENCFRYLRKEECAWPGHMTSINELLSKISCYSPYMISDFC
jgi:hypothetical protein